MIHLCLARLGWAPEILWRATPREVAAALRPPAGGRGERLSRPAFDTLMRRYPDTPGAANGDGIHD